MFFRHLDYSCYLYYANELCLEPTESLLGNKATPVLLKINQSKAIIVLRCQLHTTVDKADSAGSTWSPLLWTIIAVSSSPTPLTPPAAAPACGRIICTSAATLLLLHNRMVLKSGYVHKSFNSFAKQPWTVTLLKLSHNMPTPQGS